MNPTAIYSKTGKGVQEASGKTNLLSRGDRAILSAIDGKLSLQQLSAKFDRAADEKFFAVIRKMDADGFIREVSPGTVQRGAANAPRTVPPKPAPKPAGGGGEDLDFTQIFSAPPKMDRPSVPASRPPPSAPSSKDPMAAARDAAEQRARAEREAKAKAAAEEKAAMLSTQQVRMDAELRAKIEREKVMAAAAEGKTRAEIEARERAEAEAKVKAEADAKARAEAAERAKAEIARQGQERVEREAREAKARAEREARDKVEGAERARRESGERARREAEELRFKVEEERRAREEAERRAREEAERTRRELEERARREAEEKKALAETEELRKKLEEERKAREEAERRAQEERARRDQVRAEEERLARAAFEREEAERRALEEAAQKQRDEQERREQEEHQRQIRLAREAEDKKRRDADARKKKEEEARRWEQEEARRKSDDAYRQRAEQEDKERAEREVVESAERAEAEKQAAAAADALAGSLLADLDSFSQRQDEEKKLKEEEDRTERAEAERRAKDEQAQREREEAERKVRKAEERRRREEEERRAREEAEAREREEEARQKEEETARKKKEREAAARNQEQTDIPISSADLDRGDVEDDTRKLTPEARKALRDREREVARARSRGDVSGKKAAVAYKRKQPVQWGKPVALFLFLTLVIGAGVANFVPLDATEYEKAATEAVGVPVKIGAARMWVLTGVQLRFERVTVGDAVKIAEVRAVPELTSLLGSDKVFTRLELEKAVVQQAALGSVLFGSMKQGRLQVARVVAKDVQLQGPVALPPMDIDASLGASGRIFSVRLTGESINGLVTPGEGKLDFEATMGSFSVPFVDKLSLVEFGVKGSADRAGMTLSEFDGRLYDGTVVGKARIEWGAQWNVQGEIEARTMNAAVFAPQMVSEGRFDGKGRFAMSGPEPAKLYESVRLDGEFTVTKGALGSFDLSRALQSSSAQSSGRTPFSEMEGRVSLAGGALAFRDLRLSAGLLGAKGTLDVDVKGGLSGKVDAELRALRGTFYIGGKLGDPQLRR
jgi:hypothetical protein